jgi:2-O-(6-phospho-alpha-D-mannosyl)-D-glycerate hydrolase
MAKRNFDFFRRKQTVGPFNISKTFPMIYFKHYISYFMSQNNDKPTTKVITITPETHWDREWYLPFQEYRAKLVKMIDGLLDIFKKDPNYKNFTLDGQTIPLEDYLEVRPNRRAEIAQYIQEGRLSVGPMYILPDEYLVSGEAMIRNLMIGHKIARSFGAEPMKAGYIPDPFGHLAQMPQILAGFNVPSILFSRGFDDSFEKLKLDMEFKWKAPGNAADIIGIHLLRHYDNCTHLNTDIDKKTGNYEKAISKMYEVQKDLAKSTLTNAIILNHGSDHTFPQPELPDMIKQFNAKYGESEGLLKQADFKAYIDDVIACIKENNLILKEFEGELHGGKYQFLLSGVFSARMWIKQWNRLCEGQFERYSEPLSALAKMYNPDAADNRDYLWTGWKWLIKNHPHDSICGCSVDHVHDVDMRFRFAAAEQIGAEIVKESALEITEIMNCNDEGGEKIPVVVYNPSARKRSSLISVPVLMNEAMLKMLPLEEFSVVDDSDVQQFVFNSPGEVDERFIDQEMVVNSLNFIATDVPGFGMKTYYILPGEDREITEDKLSHKVDCLVDDESEEKITLENQFYILTMNEDGTFNLVDKETKQKYTNLGCFEDVGDWGDEYDFSGPKPDQTDNVILSKKNVSSIDVVNFGTAARIHVGYEIPIPESLSEDRKTRSEGEILNYFDEYITLNSIEKIVHIDVEIENLSLDHKTSIIFPSGLESSQIDADGHFYVVPRPVGAPKVENWSQDPVNTKHQNNFVSVSDGANVMTVMNFGLPEYRSKKLDDGTVELAVTLCRSVGWLSRGDYATRRGGAGPNLSTPGAQCLGLNNYAVGITTGKGNWFSSKAHISADDFNNPFRPITPYSLKDSMRMENCVKMSGFSISVPKREPNKNSTLGTSVFGCELDGDAFLVSSFKPADLIDDGYILRVVNMTGQSATGSLSFGKALKSAELVNLGEETLGVEKIKAKIESISDKIVKFSADPHVIASILI